MDWRDLVREPGKPRRDRRLEIDNSGRSIYSWQHEMVYQMTAIPAGPLVDSVNFRKLNQSNRAMLERDLIQFTERVEDFAGFFKGFRPILSNWKRPTWKPVDAANRIRIPLVYAIRPKHWVVTCRQSLDGKVYVKNDGKTPFYYLVPNKNCKLVDLRTNR